MMKLYTYFRSSTSHRLRIALALKGVAVEHHCVDLRSGEHLGADFGRVNPQRLLPALDTGNGVLTQSPAIIEWLDEVYPAPPLLPGSAHQRARIRALADLVGCDIHPVNNRRIVLYLEHHLGATPEAVRTWCAHWISAGFDAYEALLANSPDAGPYSVGHTPTLADVFLVPQVENARRFRVDMTRWPHIATIDAACADLDAFRCASPGVQPDAPPKPIGTSQ